jgi:hypothetical protein
LFFHNSSVSTGGFYGTFMSCTNITTIPAGLFVNNANNTNFVLTFYGCSSITSIPPNLFNNNGAVRSFDSCFRLCINLETIPNGLFDYNPNVGLATTLGASGEGFANAANVLAADEAANIGIVNQAYGQNAAIQNNEMMANENARQKYVEDMATLNQQYDNSLQQKKWKQIAAFNNGTTNWFRKKQMEQVLFPQVYTDPILGDVDFSGQGRQILEEDGTGMAPQTYSPSYAGNNQGLNTGVGSLDAWQRIYDESLPLMGEEAARARANRLEAAQINMQNRMVTGPTQRQQYNQMVQQGLTLPMPLREFGGTMYLPWVESE